MHAATLTGELKRRAAELGFSQCGVCPAVSLPGVARLDDWLAAGYAGQMRYLADRRDAYSHPRGVLDGARSIVMLAMNYRTAEPATPHAGEGRVSRYAWGDADYHDVIRARLDELASFLHTCNPDVRVRGVVDTAPLLEREFAQLAGLGWIGKNTLVLNRDAGSWFFLAALVTDVELAYDQPYDTDHCGTCRACLDACPTNAFPRPYVLDASRCISYLTIELREAMPVELRSGVGDWVFGCDVCQDVCPWNSRAPVSREAGFAPRGDSNPIDLIALFELDDAAFRARFRHTPLWRPKRLGLLRNAAIVLGNRPTEAALPALVRGLNDVEPLVRGACAWALGRCLQSEAQQALERRRMFETDEEVLSEIDTALSAAVDPIV
ncbi:MAG: tRNA epoxyqueuosine(34) reductase QueG [Planctomycetes bacterium]|nr:tRNA epoxyqueuosine(34) reductase QueG [Planctomycetota bacterium]